MELIDIVQLFVIVEYKSTVLQLSIMPSSLCGEILKRIQNHCG
jgi:hypothetical protein